jgi:protein-tyrosine kinase
VATDASALEAAAPEAPLPPNGSALGFEDLAAGFVKSAWKLTPENTLFSGANGDISPAMEEFRTLRSRLYQIREKQPLKTVLIASGMPGEGKSFLAENLAQIIIRQRGRRALLIDGDLRKPTLHQTLGAPSSPGLADYLEGEATEAAILQKGSFENLYFIPAGKPSSNAAELLSGNRFKSLVRAVAAEFDWVIVDGPPAVLVSDASMIARACDGVILVVRAASTPHDAVQKACEEFRATPIVGVVLNCVDHETANKSRYYGYDGHKAYGLYRNKAKKQKNK